MSHMTFRAFEDNRGSGPKFHKKKNQQFLPIHLVSYAKDAFLNCVCSRFLRRYAESEIQAGAAPKNKDVYAVHSLI